jgi:hypothetical protein
MPAEDLLVMVLCNFTLDDLGWHTRALKTHPHEDPSE